MIISNLFSIGLATYFVAYFVCKLFNKKEGSNYEFNPKGVISKFVFNVPLFYRSYISNIESGLLFIV
jgi:hypothetical protein